MEDEMVLIAPADFEFERLTREQLLSSSLLMREQGSGSRRVVETALEKAGCRLKSFPRVMNLDSTEAIKSAVEAGLGIGFVSRWAISKELQLRALKVAEIPGLRVARHFPWCYGRGASHRACRGFPRVRTGAGKDSVGRSQTPGTTAEFGAISSTNRQLELLLGRGAGAGRKLNA